MPVMDVLALLGVASVGLFLACHPRRDSILAVLIGVSAGFTDSQFARVHVFTVITVVWAVFKFGTKVNPVAGWVCALVASSVLIASTTVFGDLVVSSTLAVQLIALTACACFIALMSTARERRLMLYGLLFTTTISTIYALAQVAGVTPDATIHLEISSLGRPYGLTPEPDWLGMFSAIGIFLAFVLPMTRWLRFATVTLNLAGWVLAFARAAWVAVAIVLFVVVVITTFDNRRNWRKALGKGRGAALVAGLVAIGASVVLLPSVYADLVVRLQQTVASSLGASVGDDGGQARAQQIDGLLYLANHAPFYGHGLSAGGRVGVSGILYLTGDSGNSVATNWVLGLWVDAHYLAIPFMVLMAVLVVRTIGSLAGQIVAIILICSLVSNATYFPVFWLAVGLAICEVGGRSRRRNDARAEPENASTDRTEPATRSPAGPRESPHSDRDVPATR